MIKEKNQRFACIENTQEDIVGLIATKFETQRCPSLLWRVRNKGVHDAIWLSFESNNHLIQILKYSWFGLVWISPLEKSDPIQFNVVEIEQVFN